MDAPSGPHCHARRNALALLWITSLLFALASNQLQAQTDYTDAIRRLEQMVGDELSRGTISGVSIVLVDDQ